MKAAEVQSDSIDAQGKHDKLREETIEKFLKMDKRASANDKQRTAYSKVTDRLKQAQPPGRTSMPRIGDILRTCDDETFQEICDMTDASYIVFLGESESTMIESPDTTGANVASLPDLMSQATDIVRIMQ